MSEDEEGWPRLVPNLVWAEERWCIAADIDCMSTYIGSDVPLPDLDALGVEWVAVQAAHRVS